MMCFLCWFRYFYYRVAYVCDRLCFFLFASAVTKRPYGRLVFAWGHFHFVFLHFFFLRQLVFDDRLCTARARASNRGDQSMHNWDNLIRFWIVYPSMVLVLAQRLEIHMPFPPRGIWRIMCYL